MKDNKYYVYMLRCNDDSIYTGITTDLERRMEEHFSKDKKAAKYTKVVGVKKMELAFETSTRSMASKLEYWIKKLSKKEKEKFIKNKDFKVFKDKIDGKNFHILCSSMRNSDFT